MHKYPTDGTIEEAVNRERLPSLNKSGLSNKEYMILKQDRRVREALFEQERLALEASIYQDRSQKWYILFVKLKSSKRIAWSHYEEERRASEAFREQERRCKGALF